MKHKPYYKLTHYDPDTWIDSAAIADFRTLKDARNAMHIMLDRFPLKHGTAYIRIEKVTLIGKVIRNPKRDI